MSKYGAIDSKLVKGWNLHFQHYHQKGHVEQKNQIFAGLVIMHSYLPKSAVCFAEKANFRLQNSLH